MAESGDEDVARRNGCVAGRARTEVSDERCIERTPTEGDGMTQNN
jgi:hypothetical protein